MEDGLGDEEATTRTPLLGGPTARDGEPESPAEAGGGGESEGEGEGGGGGGTRFEAYLNLTNCLIGSGLLALPAAFASAGIFGGVGGLVLICLCNLWSCRVLLLCQRSFPEVQRYDDIGALAFGSAGRSFSHLVLCASQLGFVCSYIVFAAENVVDVLRDPLGTGSGVAVAPGLLAVPHAFHPGELQVTLLMAAVGALLALIRRMETLASLSGVAIYCIVGAVASLVVDGFQFGEPLHSPLDAGRYGPPVRLRTLPAFFGIASFSYCCQGPILSLANSIRVAMPEEEGQPAAEVGGAGRRPLPRAEAKAAACMSVVSWSMVTVTVVYALFGGLGYMFFTSDVKSDVVENLHPGGTALAVKLALSAVCLLSVPVQLFPVIELLENAAVQRGFLAAPGGGGDMASPDYWRANLLRTAAVALPAAIATGLPCFGQVTDLVGAVCSSATSCVFPPLCYMAIERRRGSLSSRDAICCSAVAAVGVLGGVLCTAEVVEALLGGECD